MLFINNHCSPKGKPIPKPKAGKINGPYQVPKPLSVKPANVDPIIN